ncbi:MAG: membrane dipeptidase [Rectinema sp.]
MVPIFDMHADIIMDILRREDISDENSVLLRFKQHIDRMKRGAVQGAVLVDCRMAGESAETKNFEEFIAISKILRSHQDESYLIATSSEEFDNSIRDGRWVGILCYEGLRAANGNLLWLKRLYKEAGLRIAMLTHNDSNEFATGAADPNGNPASKNPLGLTEAGQKAVELMNEMGILIDLSHASPMTRRDVLSYSKKPVMLSHTSRAEVYDNGRNLSDKDIREIAEHGGLIGCMTSPAALADIRDRANHTLERYMHHLRHMIDVAGEDHVGLGLHFCEYLYTQEEYPPVEGLEDASKAGVILKEISKWGLSTYQIEKIAYRNFARVFKEATD